MAYENGKVKNNLYMYVNHIRSASKEKKGKWDVYEEVHVKGSKKNRLMQSAVIVLDCVERKVIKNRTGVERTFDDFLNYLAKGHKQVAEIRDTLKAYDEFQKRLELEAKKVDIDLGGDQEGSNNNEEDSKNT